jgi:3-isopropylmalate/(R)-2-methylmalate dehydratase small subunit
VIAPSFGDIFSGNAIKNGLLPAVVDAAAAEAMLVFLQISDAPRIVVDLETQTITFGTASAAFQIDAGARQQLLNGWDDLDRTLQHKDAIAAFKARHRGEVAGAWPLVRT